MRKLILEEWMSLDGCIADEAGGLDFFTNLSPGQNTYSDTEQLKFLEEVDIILLGRKTYELFVDFWPNATSDTEAIADKLNEIPKIVISNRITKAPWGEWPAAKVVNGDPVNAIRSLKQKEGKSIVLWGSISLAQALMKENLIDEYHIQICPVVIGGGRKLFSSEMSLDQLRLQEVRQYDTGVVFLRYTAV